MKILDILRIKKYLAMGVISTAFIFLFYPTVQILATTQNIQNIDIWFASIPPINFVLFLIFTILFGINISLFSYNRNRKVCEHNTKKVLGGSSIGTIFSFFVGICPACTGFVALFGIPLSVTLALVQFNTVFFLISIGLLLLSIYFSDGFKK